MNGDTRKVRMNGTMHYLKRVIITVRMVLDIKLMNGDGDAAARAGLNVPHTLPVLWISVRIAWAVEGASWPSEISTTTCRGQ